LSPQPKDDDASTGSVKVVKGNPDEDSKSKEDAKVVVRKERSQGKIDLELQKRNSLGFRDWEDQQKAVDVFHQKEAERKALEERRKAEELAAKEAEVFKRTETGLDKMKKEQAERERQERLKREEEAKRKEEEAHAKHHNLRKEMAAKKKAKEEAALKARKKAEEKRRKKLAEQAKKMKKFEEETRWKTLPNWKKEREEELLKKVDQLKSYDPARSKYEFFDVHRVPDAWDEELLDVELKKAKCARGEKLINQLKSLLPSVTKATYFQEDREDQWDIPGLKEKIAIETEEVKAEEATGSMAFEKLLLVEPDAKKNAYWDASRRPRWLVADMDNMFIARVRVIFSTVKQYKPEVKEDVYCKDGEWQVNTMQKDIAIYKVEDGEKKFTIVEEVMKAAKEPVEKAKYFNKSNTNKPWNLELMESDRNDRIAISIQITKEEDSTTVKENIAVGNSWSYIQLWKELAKLVHLPEGEDERLTILQIDGCSEINKTAKLGDLMKHKSVVAATLTAPVNGPICCIIS